MILLLLLFTNPAYARLHIGASLTDIRLNSPDYKLVKESEPSVSYNIGYSKEFHHNLVVDFTTNAPFSLINDANNSDKRTIILKDGTHLSKSEVTYGSILLGKRFNRFVPSLSMTYIQKETETYLNDSMIRERKHTVVFGANMNYFFTSKFSSSLFCLFPNSDLHLRFSCGVGINQYF